jgi:monofunctional biosynthetic peptidoglycan transglycosylase
MIPALPEPSAGRRRWLVRGALLLLVLPLAGLAVLWITLPEPEALARTNPTTTALIEQRRAEARTAGRRFEASLRWIPLERISRRLVDAVVASEDATFFVHGGFDWPALGEAVRFNWARRRYVRGASTITQQLAKNLYLGTEKNLLRKAREALLTARLERRLDKRRILALYLNVAEWGEGTFGAEAGARRHFGAGAGSVTTAQAVLLASMLPSPRRATLAPAPAWLAARSRGLLDRLRDEHVVGAEEYAGARLELERYLGAAPAATAGEPEAPPVDDASDDLPLEAPADGPAGPPAPAEPGPTEPTPEPEPPPEAGPAPAEAPPVAVPTPAAP